MLQVIKRDGTKVPFDKNKIALAIEKAEHSSTGLYEEGLAQRIADEIEEYATKLQKDMTIYAIEDQVYYKLIEYHNPATARAYEGYKAVQAFKRRQNTTDDDVIGLLAGDAFKSYRKQIKPLNNKLQILPYSERCRAIFYFQKQYRTPPPIDNAKEIVRFIETALHYIKNVQLSQNWRACLDVCNTKEAAVSLLVYYGWYRTSARSYLKLKMPFTK